MGLDTFAISKATRVTGHVEDDRLEICDPGYVYYATSLFGRLDGWKPGNYVVGEGGKSFGGWSGSYLAYGEWRRELCLLALRVSPEAVWQHPRRFRGQPFVELINFPDGGNFAIGPKTSAKLYHDFVAYSAKARQYFVKRSPTLTPLVPGIAPRSRHRVVRAQRSQDLPARSAATLTDSTTACATTDRRWMLDAYRLFRGAFRTARNDGFVFFW